MKPPSPPKYDSPEEQTLVFRATPGLVVAKKFRLEHELRSGGQGTVWVATHLTLDARVAVKFLELGGGALGDTLARFSREAKAAARIRSSNVVQILDFGIDRNMPYIAMELLEGEDLGARIKRAGRLSLAELVPIVEGVARGLQLAHERGLVHRDLKPQNIFLASEGDIEVPKILDFGVAKAFPQADMEASDTTAAGTLLGTPYYMSPEQVRARTVIDHRSDLWSLGITVFYALTGKRPFRSKVVSDLLVQICSDPMPLATELAPGLPAEVDRFFDRALARDPDERFPSAKQFADALAALPQHHAPSRHAAPAPAPRAADSASESASLPQVPTAEQQPTPPPASDAQLPLAAPLASARVPAAAAPAPAASASEGAGTGPPSTTPLSQPAAAYQVASASDSLSGEVASTSTSGELTSGSIGAGVHTVAERMRPKRGPWLVLGGLGIAAFIALAWGVSSFTGETESATEAAAEPNEPSQPAAAIEGPSELSTTSPDEPEPATPPAPSASASASASAKPSAKPKAEADDDRPSAPAAKPSKSSPARPAAQPKPPERDLGY